MICPHCHAKNSFIPVYGVIGSSFNCDDPNSQSGVIVGAKCYNCGHWIEPAFKPAETRPIGKPSANIHKPTSEHRRLASATLNQHLMAYKDTIIKLRDSGMGFREIVAVLDRKRVKVSYTKLRLWYQEIMRGDAKESIAQAA